MFRDQMVELVKSENASGINTVDRFVFPLYYFSLQTWYSWTIKELRKQNCLHESISLLQPDAICQILGLSPAGCK